jgi:hypothetical protein
MEEAGTALVTKGLRDHAMNDEAACSIPHSVHFLTGRFLGSSRLAGLLSRCLGAAYSEACLTNTRLRTQDSGIEHPSLFGESASFEGENVNLCDVM